MSVRENERDQLVYLELKMYFCIEKLKQFFFNCLPIEEIVPFTKNFRAAEKMWIFVRNIDKILFQQHSAKIDQGRQVVIT